MGGARARFEVECPPLATAATPKSLCCENKARVESVSTPLVPVMMMMMMMMTLSLVLIFVICSAFFYSCYMLSVENILNKEACFM